MTIDWKINFWTLLWISTYILALISVPSVLMERRGRPQAAISWLLAIFSLPWVGILLWWLFGRRHLRRVQRKRRSAEQMRSQQLGSSRSETHPASPVAWPLARATSALESGEYSVYPATDHNRVELLIDADDAYPALEGVIQNAREHVHLMFYIWQADATGRRFRDLLVEKARSGVRVRVLIDGWGSFWTPDRFMRPLREAGAEVAVFLPARGPLPGPFVNFRNHRKLVVADGRYGLVGGMNLGDEYLRPWRDLAILLEGPVVDQLQEVFRDDWFFTTGREISDVGPFASSENPGSCLVECLERVTCGIVAGGPHTPFNTTHDAFFLAITRASERIRIITPYFIPDTAILMALRTAVCRGVDVQVLMPGKTGNHPMAWWAARSYFPDLLASGVRIFEYDRSMLHTKAAAFDWDLSVVGSANMDNRSFRLNFEVSCFIRGRSLNEQLQGLFASYLEGARELHYKDVENQPYLIRLGESVAHLLSPLL